MRTVLSVPFFLILAALCGTAAAETEDATTVAPIEVVGTTPLDAGGARIDRLPAAASVLRVEDLARAGPASTLRALDERLGGVSLDQAQANPFQPSLIYRGFEASPLAGNDLIGKGPAPVELLAFRRASVFTYPDETRDYALANLHAEYRVTEHLEVFGQVTNVTGSRYATFGTYAPLDAAPVLEAPPLTDPSSVSPGAPRAGYVGLRFRF